MTWFRNWAAGRYDRLLRPLAWSAKQAAIVGDVTGRVEAVDVATPLTTERYTGNWQGSMESWMITTKTIGMMMGKGMSKTLPGLDGFYMIGQWVQPGGGLPPAALSGRDFIQLICHADRRPFVTTIPQQVETR